ncbi:MAG: hypothetical protein K6C05_07485 [Anaerovibrio sp.]|uniref:hypothetical protein n=1 Tax=Anaerovibrio sp. TaxID=1872532 RepID=UPI0025DA81E8|nr:hypothetical protein [Anaerovibrio sp.]MCR5176681.1 hypothetical protein [Anaerovibrio sp.]
MKKNQHKLIMSFGILLILLGGFGFGFTYVYDHRPCDNLSGYCDIDFQTGVDINGKVTTANLTILDYRFSGSAMKPAITLICDDNIFNMKASVRQTPPSYSIAFYNDKTTLKNTNKLFVEFPPESFDAIKKADVITIQYSYENGDKVSLPLSEPDMDYWKTHLQ